MSLIVEYIQLQARLTPGEWGTWNREKDNFFLDEEQAVDS